ncbi:MAG: 16S rRNA (guanine(527)-N(7))-methyltransferase RsmG [Deltaproteobacteria bacterium]|nr:16S rRNA (guanine(527)-N(7))-methyltransferase RsmG [Deltaproteobacteria bacterium]
MEVPIHHAAGVKRFLETLVHGLDAWGLHAPMGFLDQCLKYYALIEEWNRVFRLVGHRNPEDVAVNLFLDSLAPAPYIPEGAQLLDVGSGAGFPGLVLRLFRPDLQVTLVDATRKKVNFLKQVRLELGLSGLQALQCRLGKEACGQLRARTYDAAISKALGSMNLLVNLAGPYLKPGGSFIVMKGPGGLDEPTDSLPGAVITVPYALPEGGGKRTLAMLSP